MYKHSEYNQIKEECEKLKIENKKMITELTRLLNVNHRNYERIQQLELEKEEQKRKFDEIKRLVIRSLNFIFNLIF